MCGLLELDRVDSLLGISVILAEGFWLGLGFSLVLLKTFYLIVSAKESFEEGFLVMF